MEDSDSSNSIVEERTELMVSPADGNLKLRTAHFISPSIGLGSADETLVANLPRNCLSSLPITFEPQKWPLQTKFTGWRYPRKDWQTWVLHMTSLHGSTWKKAGIFEAVMNSMYKIERNTDLIFGVAEKWCHETKSFVFSWGEATITLEDVMILGGYSVLGSPVFTPVETEEMEETLEKLNHARKEIFTGKCKKVSQSLWMKKFMYSDSEMEHDAFLALWLSRFVLPTSFDIVDKSVFPIALHLARGTRIALAPSVLANIYRDLNMLKQKIVASSRLESNCDDGNVAPTIMLRSPLALVQVWIWERFLEFRPKPNLIVNGETRLALWHGQKCKVQDVRSVLDSAKEKFDWRPYIRKITNWDGTAKFYGDKAIWISIDSSLDDDLLSFARCLRASELVGLDCVEQYLPNRVALQFGMDQDIPGYVPRFDYSPEIAWGYYHKSLDGAKLHVPPRIFDASVTTRYSEWWKQSMLSLQEINKDLFTSCRMIPKSFKRPRQDDDNCTAFKEIVGNKVCISNEKSASYHQSLFLDSDDEDQLTVAKMLKSSGQCQSFSYEGLLLKENMLRANDYVNEYNVTASVPLRFTPKCNVVQAKSSVNKPGFPSKHIDEVTPLFPPGFPPKCVREFVLDEVTERSERSACDHEIVGDKVCRSNEELASHHQSLSLDSDDEDQLTVAEMLKSNHNLDNNVNCRDAGENSAGQCQSFSSSMADNELPKCMEPITTLETEKIMSAEAATEVSKGASIQDSIGSNAGKSGDKAMGNNGSPDDKPASVNDILRFGNSVLEEISKLNLEARISRLERLFSERKAARKVKSFVKAYVVLN